MMRKEELGPIAEAKGISLRNAERDYLLDLCLHAISSLRDDLAFKGGTALYKFHNLNRFSEDLDFTQNAKRLDPERLIARMARECALIGINSHIGPVERYQKELNASISFNGPLYDGSKQSMARVSINISLRERPVSMKPLFYTSPYREIPSFEMYVLAPEELLAEKIRAVMTREKARDVYDVWFLLRKGTALDMGLVERKLRICKVHFTRGAFEGSVLSKASMWKKDLGPLIIGRLPDFKATTEALLRLLDAAAEGK